MIDKVEYWINLANEDLSVAELLITGHKYLQAGFFCHLIIEKALKAAIANSSDEIPPKTHDLIKLAQRGGIYDILSEDQKDLLDELTPLNIEARYPSYKENISKILTTEKTKLLFKKTEELLCWIKQQLER